jgi:hypothetical protein
MSLKGKKIVVVGGSSGIGLSTAELAKRGEPMSSSPRATLRGLAPWPKN